MKVTPNRRLIGISLIKKAKFKPRFFAFMKSSEFNKVKNVIWKLLPIAKLVSGQNYKTFTRNQNKNLFKRLKKIGFFKFHITNLSQNMVTEHQIIKFLTEGWRLLRQGKVAQKGQIEIHHYDHDVQNNSPENLEYVTPEINKLATEFTEKFIKSDKPAQIIREIINRFKGQVLIILGKAIRIVDVILKTVELSKSVGLEKIGRSPYGGLSAKQMLANFKKFGFLFGSPKLQKL